MNEVVPVNVSSVRVEFVKEILPDPNCWIGREFSESACGMGICEQSLAQVGKHVIFVFEGERRAHETLVTSIRLEVARALDNGRRSASGEEFLSEWR